MDKGIKSENEEIARGIAKAVNSIKFGYVQVTVQNSKVVQIETTEKIRLNDFSTRKKGFIKS